MSGVVYSPMGLRWREPCFQGSVNAMRRLRAVLASWDDTPYQHNQQIKGVGVNCSRFLAGVLDEMYRRPTKTVLPDFPADGAMHDRAGAFRALRFFLDHYPNHTDEVVDGWCEPGDVIVVCPVNGGPGHAMIVGVDPNTVWHSPGPEESVCFTGFSLPEKYQRLFAVYRMSDRENWA